MRTAIWLVLAGVHLLPAFAFFRPASIERLYRIARDNPLFVLMHHRAALFLGVFITCIIAAFDPSSRPLACVVVGVSMLGFLHLYYRAGAPSALRKIARVDLLGLPALAYCWFDAASAFAG